MQLIHYCGFAFAIIFAICNHSAQKAERILHVCQKVLEFLKSAKIVLLKNGQMDWKKAMVIDKSEWVLRFHRNEKKDIILLLAGNTLASRFLVYFQIYKMCLQKSIS